MMLQVQEKLDIGVLEMITKEQSYQKIKDMVQIKLNYYEKISNHFPNRSSTEIKQLKQALKFLDELYSKHDE
jgi:hypothetical protein